MYELDGFHQKAILGLSRADCCPLNPFIQEVVPSDGPATIDARWVHWGKKNDAMANDMSNNTSAYNRAQFKQEQNRSKRCWRGWLMCPDNPKNAGISLWTKPGKAAKLWDSPRKTIPCYDPRTQHAAHLLALPWNEQHLFKFICPSSHYCNRFWF